MMDEQPHVSARIDPLTLEPRHRRAMTVAAERSVSVRELMGANRGWPARQRGCSGGGVKALGPHRHREIRRAERERTGEVHGVSRAEWTGMFGVGGPTCAPAI